MFILISQNTVKCWLCSWISWSCPLCIAGQALFVVLSINSLALVCIFSDSKIQFYRWEEVYRPAKCIEGSKVMNRRSIAYYNLNCHSNPRHNTVCACAVCGEVLLCRNGVMIHSFSYFCRDLLQEVANFSTYYLFISLNIRVLFIVDLFALS